MIFVIYVVIVKYVLTFYGINFSLGMVRRKDLTRLKQTRYHWFKSIPTFYVYLFIVQKNDEFEVQVGIAPKRNGPPKVRILVT